MYGMMGSAYILIEKKNISVVKIDFRITCFHLTLYFCFIFLLLFMHTHCKIDFTAEPLLSILETRS